MEIGDILQELRKDRGLKQKDLAKIMHLSDATIGAYETNTNEPPLESIRFFAEFYGVSTDYILGLTKIRTPWNKVVERLSSENAALSSIENILAYMARLSPKNNRVMMTVLKSLSVLDEEEKKNKEVIP